MEWRDICREKNGPDVCDSGNICEACIKGAIAKAVAEIWDKLESECWDIRCRSEPIADTGDSDTVWEVVSHHMSKPFERIEGIGSTPQEAFAAAIRAGEGE